MAHTELQIAEALSSLGCTNSFLEGVPTNNTQLQSMTTRFDDDNNEIALGFTWTQVSAEITRLENIEKQKTTDKTNAINKLKELGLTDDEIKAIKEVV